MKCKRCLGSGYEKREIVECKNCNGQSCYKCSAGLKVLPYETCRSCNGKGS